MQGGGNSQLITRTQGVSCFREPFGFPILHQLCGFRFSCKPETESRKINQHNTKAELLKDSAARWNLGKNIQEVLQCSAIKSSSAASEKERSFFFSTALDPSLNVFITYGVTI